MLARKLVHLTGGLTLLCLCAAANGAVFVSEVSTSDRTNELGQLLTPYVEISGLGSLRAVDVIVTRARSGPSFGQVLEVIHVPDGPAVRLIALLQSGQSWDTQAYPNPSPLPGHLTQHLLASGYPFNDARSILVFDRPTKLVPLGGTIDAQLSSLNGASLLASLTFGPAGVTLAHPWDSSGTMVALANPQNAISVPLDDSNQPTSIDGATHLVGQTTPLSLRLSGWDYALNPGIANRPFGESLQPHLPEPCTAVVVLLGMPALIQRRRSSETNTCD